MMKTKLILLKTVAIILSFGVLFAGCASTTLIESVPSGAKVYLNGEYKGVTPYSHSDTRIVGSTTSVRLEKEGYETLHTSFSRDESADIGPIIGGIFFLFPFLWTMKYNPVHTYELKLSNNADLIKDTNNKAIIKNDDNQISYVLR